MQVLDKNWVKVLREDLYTEGKEDISKLGNLYRIISFLVTDDDNRNIMFEPHKINSFKEFGDEFVTLGLNKTKVVTQNILYYFTEHKKEYVYINSIGSIVPVNKVDKKVLCEGNTEDCYNYLIGIKEKENKLGKITSGLFYLGDFYPCEYGKHGEKVKELAKELDIDEEDIYEQVTFYSKKNGLYGLNNIDL